VDHDLRAQDSATDLGDRLRELSRCAVDLTADCHPVIVGATGVGAGGDTPHDLRD
ncbi:MAG: hypothetical protein JWP56_696, partial [Aeromicrobium sp.]|nr:hypothetical protein [Aeromicrobium sp.]